MTRRALHSSIAALTASVLASAAIAQTTAAAGSTQALPMSPPRAIVDPTVPPPGFGKPGTGSADATNTPAPVQSRLQMIVRGPGETRMALINGETLRVGDRVRHDGGEARVLRITDGAVTLDRSGTRYTLELVPGANAAVRCAQGAGSNDGMNTRSAPRARCTPQPADS